MITKENEHSEDIFKRLNSALKRLGDEVKINIHLL